MQLGMFVSVSHPFYKVLHPLREKAPHVQVDDYVSSLPATPEVASTTSTQEQIERPMTKGERLGA